MASEDRNIINSILQTLAAGAGGAATGNPGFGFKLRNVRNQEQAFDLEKQKLDMQAEKARAERSIKDAIALGGIKETKGRLSFLTARARDIIANRGDATQTFEAIDLLQSNPKEFERQRLATIEDERTFLGLGKAPNIPEDIRRLIAVFGKEAVDKMSPEEKIAALRQIREGINFTVPTALLTVDEVGRRAGIDTTTKEGLAEANQIALETGVKTPPSGFSANFDADTGQFSISQGPGAANISAPVTTDLQKKIRNQTEVLDRLSLIDDEFQEDFLTAKGKVKGFALRLADFANLDLSDDQVKFMQGQATFMNKVRRFMFAYVNSISGAQFSEKELRALANSVLNEKLPPRVFKAELSAFINETKRNIAIQRRLLEEGFSGTTEELLDAAGALLRPGFKKTHQQRGEELVLRKNIKGDKLRQQLIKEGYPRGN
jgi:hypothetical protein